MKRILLDTNIVVSALLWRGSPCTLIELAVERRIDLYSSPELLDELLRTLDKKKFAAKLAATGLSVWQLVDAYAGMVTVVVPEAIPRAAPDPDDDIVLAAALSAQADMIVTGDKPLLSLGHYSGIPLLDVAGALAHIDPAVVPL